MAESQINRFEQCFFQYHSDRCAPVRPGLERMRDLIAEGVIARVLMYDPDRLSHNYAYQVLLLEEFARHGTEVVFLKAPPADTPEHKLLLQFKGMIADMSERKSPNAPEGANATEPKPGCPMCFPPLRMAIGM